jgi:hypothetical protein
MDSDEIRNVLRERLAAPPPAPLETLTKLLRTYWSDADGVDEVKAQLARMAQVNSRSLEIGLAAIGELLQTPPEGDLLVQLIELEGNQVLPQPTPDGAIRWLQDFAQLLHGALSPIDD